MNVDTPVKIGALKTRANETWESSCNSSKAQSVLNWEPRFSFDEGLRKTISWFEANQKALFTS